MSSLVATVSSSPSFDTASYALGGTELVSSCHLQSWTTEGVAFCSLGHVHPPTPSQCHHGPFHPVLK